jgi:DNA-binding transcriptional regulator YiaG
LNLRVPDPTQSLASLSLFKSNEEVLAKRARPAEGSEDAARIARKRGPMAEPKAYEKIRTLRATHKLTHAVLAERFGLTLETVRRVLAR